MFEFFSALFSQRNTIKEDKQTNKAFAKRKKEVLSILKDLDDIDLNFSTIIWKFIGRSFNNFRLD